MSHAAFWKSICAQPDDDTPRLVYADWLDEQGDPASAAKAEFIRAQVELARIEPWTERAIELKIREQVLLQDHHEVWLDRLPKWIRRTPVTFRRGMPYGIYCRAREYIRNAGGLAKNTPIQEMRFSTFDVDDAAKLATVPHLSRMRELQPIDGSWATWGTMLASPHLTGLRELWLLDHGGHSGFPHGQFLDVFQMPAVRKIQRLHLRVNDRVAGASAGLFRDLAESSLVDLRELDLTAEEMHPQRLAELFNSPVVAQLASFRTHQSLDDHALGGFTQVKKPPPLKSLAFVAVYASQEELPRVFVSQLLRNVESLEISGIREEGFKALATSPRAGQLRVLKLPSGYVSNSLWREILEAGHLRDLLELQLPCWRSEGNPLATVANTPGLENLRHLDIRDLVRAPVDTLDVVAKSQHLPNLRAVTVSSDYGGGYLSAIQYPDTLRPIAAKYASRFAVLVR
jgi:uncharacterized protein (TIGR02996 family)